MNIQSTSFCRDRFCTVLVWSVGLCLGMTGPAAVSAQTVSPPEIDRAGQQGEILLRQQQEIERDRQREADRARQTPSPLPSMAPPAQSTIAPLAAGGCLTVKRLDLAGAERLSRREKRVIDKMAVGRCVGLPEINEMLKQITEYYIDRGLVTTRAYIPQQSAEEGVLTIVVIEGTVERIEIQPKGSANLGTAFPPMVGRVLNLRHAEQGIDQINRLGSNNAKIDIRPGTAPGSSTIVVINQPRYRLSGGVSVDNSGSPETGLWQAGVSATFDNPLGLNDMLSGNFRKNAEDLPPGVNSQSGSISYSVPWGWWTANLSVSQSRYGSIIQGITRDFDTNGTSDALSVRLDRVMYRDNRMKLTLYSSLNRGKTRNFIAGLRIDTSSRILTNATMAANLSAIAGPALFSFDLGYTRGLDWLGALADLPNQPDGAPKGQFSRVNFGAGVNIRAKIGAQPIGWSTQMTGQWSNDSLFASEQISIAGPYAVRGYRDVRVLGDSGLFIRNELSMPLRIPVPGTKLIIGAKPFVGFDYGKTRGQRGLPGQYLTGWAAGLGLQISRIAVQLSWSGSGPRSSGLPSDHSFFTRLSLAF
jgi:hemolysin activation/secretion protein